jgi:AcrR family transcriptional regulator
MPPDTRSRIVGTAMELLWRKGYGPTSMSDLLQAAGVNSGSLYHFFTGKQDLLLAVLDAYPLGIRAMLLEPARRGVDDPIERIFALLARYRELIVETDCTYGCPIGSLALEIHEPDPAVRERLAANFSAWVDAIVGCLDAAGPHLAADMDRRALAELVLTTMEGGVMLTRT